MSRPETGDDASSMPIVGGICKTLDVPGDPWTCKGFSPLAWLQTSPKYTVYMSIPSLSISYLNEIRPIFWLL
ncbi:hypothetical protein SERLADRAFT_476677, partial [Serpula lacrymans var. lacrymans S7.9]